METRTANDLGADWRITPRMETVKSDQIVWSPPSLLGSTASYRLIALAFAFVLAAALSGDTPVQMQSVLPQGGSVVGGSATIGAPAN
jgi:hypothetical protein